MGIDPNYLEDLVTNGWKCLNCGERVKDGHVRISEFAIDFSGICRSETCRVLPPGGNPYCVVIS